MTTENGRDMFAQSGMATPGFLPAAEPATPDQSLASSHVTPHEDKSVESIPDSWLPSVGFVHNLRMLLPSYKAAYEQYVTGVEEKAARKVQDIIDYRDALDAGIKQLTKQRSGTITMTHVKGGVSKTTTSGYVASTLGETARKTVTVIDNNPMWGTTARLLGIPVDETLTVRHIFSLIEKGAINNHRQFVGGLGSNKHNVSLIASDAVEQRESLYEHDTAKQVISIAQDNSIFVVNDTSNHIGGGAMQAALELSDVVVIPCITSSNGIEGTMVTIANYRAWGHKDKMRHAIVVVSALPEGKSAEDYRTALGLNEHQILIGIPEDPRLAADTVIDLDQTDPFTRIAYLELVYAIVRVMVHVQDNGFGSEPLRLTQGQMLAIPSGNSPELPYIRSSN